MSNPFASSVEDSYNPFAPGSGSSEPAENATSNGFSSPTPASEPDFSTPAETPSSKPSSGITLPSFGGSGGYKDTVTGVTISEQEMEAREKELARREAEIAATEKALADGTYVKPKSRKNFPFPCLGLWEYYPENDLPESSWKLVNLIKWVYLATWISLGINMIGSLFCLAPGAARELESVATIIVLGIVIFVVFGPISFECGFFVLYNSLRDGKAVKFFCFMFLYVLWFAFNVFLLIGLSGWTLGYISMINLFAASEDSWVGIFALVYDICGSLCCAAMVWTFIQLIKYYKAEGLTKKALQEASVMAAQYAKENPEQAREVVNAAKEAAATTGSNPFA